ncbi:DNA internalization-related competence protein ComEC/Rec2 [Salimicrobium flavidum]|uniref:DNA internalization-related competence protein ComEC/Rec2 n=1 Tax=Salimicrobium flavidum TaxID=570947 RepID=UPI0022858D42|nr:DNA internalization-related competence protein ComEC/Rec2 [Salimicrobium flavidum]
MYAHIPEQWPWFLLCLVWMLSFSRLQILFPLMLSAFFLGVLLYTLSLQPPIIEEGPYHGEILSPATRSERSESFSLKTTENHKIQVTHFSDSEKDFFFHEFRAGAVCAVRGEVEDYSSASNPGEFDYSEFMRNQGIAGQVLIDSKDDLNCEGSSFRAEFYAQRKAIIERFLQETPGSLKPWGMALVFGDQDAMDEEVLKSFREWGLSHVLAISGLHVGLMCGIIYSLLYRSGVATLSQVKLLLFLFLPVFAFIAGGQPSVLRASMMVFFLLGCWTLKIKPSMTDLLAMIAFLLLITNPNIVYNIGFQFSFAVTFSLLLSASILKKDTRPWVLSMRVSFIAQLAILPLQLHYFYQFSPLSVLFNLILVPYFTILFIPFIFLLLLSMYMLPQFLYEGIAIAGGMVHEEVIDMAIFIGQEWNYVWVTGSFPYSWFLPYYICFLLMMVYWQKEKLTTTFLCGSALTFVLILYGTLPYIDEEGRVTFLDVGQGDSVVIELPYRKGVVLIDAAGVPAFQSNPDKTADRVIIPFLKSKGLQSVDATFITHDDADHNGSVQRLIEEEMTGELFISEFEEGTFGKGRRVLRRGDRYELGGYSFAVLAPEKKATEKNDDSLVLYTELGGEYWLFTGDISVEVEKELVSAYGTLPVHHLKVAHHGSKTSTSEEFVQLFSPETGVISAGRNNRYGHPHPEVLERLISENVEVWRTDEHGAVTIPFSKKEVGEISGFKNEVIAE